MNWQNPELQRKMIYMKKQARQQMIKTDLLFFVVLRSLSNVYYIEVLEVSFDFLDFRKTPGQIFTLGAKDYFRTQNCISQCLKSQKSLIIITVKQCYQLVNYKRTKIGGKCQKMPKNKQSNETFRVILIEKVSFCCNFQILCNVAMQQKMHKYNVWNF